MAYFHVTRQNRLASILESGLRAHDDRNFPDAEPGVYLSTHAGIAIGFLLEHIFKHAKPDDCPADDVGEIRIIAIDRSRVDEQRLRPDPQISGYEKMFWLYDGVVDIVGMPVLTVDQVMKSDF